MRIFTKRFGALLSCTFEIADPIGGKLTMPTICWKGRFRKKHARAYIDWMNSIHEELSSSWGVELFRSYRTPKRKWENYSYRPGEPAQLDFVSANGPAQPYGEPRYIGAFHVNPPKASGNN